MHTQTKRRQSATLAALGFTIASLGGLAACDRETRSADADNTARNVRERDQAAPTPMNQGENEGDRTITANVRKAVVGNDSLSSNAHNVKIITQDGVVTLRGPVETPQEKTTIATAAKDQPGVKRVDDQLEVKAKD